MSENDLKYQLQPVRIRSETGTEDVYYPALYYDLPEEAKLCAERELNEAEENKANGIRKLKKFMKRENLTCPDGRILVTVLRNCKYDIKKSEKKLKQYLKIRQLTSEKLAQMDMSTFGFILEEFIFVGLPYRDKHGRVIVYTHPSPNIDKYSHEDIRTFAIVCLLFLLSFPMSSIFGIAHLGECSTPHLPVFYSILKIFKKFMTPLNDMPIRIARIDLFNEHFLCRWCLNILRPFMPDKIRKRVMFHGSGFDSVHKLYHPDILPYEIGGTLGPLSIKHYKEELLCFVERLKDENSSKTI